MDRLIIALDEGLRTLFARPRALRPRPQPAEAAKPNSLTPEEARLSGALMRVNHVGEICAQALYQGQALATRNRDLRDHLRSAADEETDHLAWTRERLDELGARASLLDPLWWAGAFGMGVLAGAIGDRVSLGFVVETERQVEAHLQSHLSRLPVADSASRAIVAQMKADEAQHAEQAEAAGAATLPPPVRHAMKVAAKVMTTTAHYL